MNPYIDVLTTYMRALGESDYAVIKRLFAVGGAVHSPFLGEMAADKFFDRLAGASEVNTITPIDIFISGTEANRAACYFQYDWTVRGGSTVSFKVMDLFTFEPGTDRITRLELIYDTHPVRMKVGNKYED